MTTGRREDSEEATEIEVTAAMVEAGEDVLFEDWGLSLAVGFFDAGELVEKVYRAMARHRRPKRDQAMRQNRGEQG
jgi:hypothetical protein